MLMPNLLFERMGSWLFSRLLWIRSGMTVAALKIWAWISQCRDRHPLVFSTRRRVALKAVWTMTETLTPLPVVPGGPDQRVFEWRWRWEGCSGCRSQQGFVTASAKLGPCGTKGIVALACCQGNRWWEQTAQAEFMPTVTKPRKILRAFSNRDDGTMVATELVPMRPRWSFQRAWCMLKYLAQSSYPVSGARGSSSSLTWRLLLPV